MAALFWLASLILMLLAQPTVAQPISVMQDELQIAIRRYMQCQADNVGVYNIQVQLSQARLEQALAELDAVKKELDKLKAAQETKQ